jgi:hypothetical protein
MVPPLRSLALALTLVAGLAWASPAVAGPTIPAKGSATGQVTLQVNPTPENPVGRQEYVATGTATLLGRYTHRGVTFFTADGQVLPTSSYVLTTADGATVAGNYSGTVAPIPGTANFRFAVAVDGRGTGRLAGVTLRQNTVAILDGLTGAFRYESLGVWIRP